MANSQLFHDNLLVAEMMERISVREYSRVSRVLNVTMLPISIADDHATETNSVFNVTEAKENVASLVSH